MRHAAEFYIDGAWVAPAGAAMIDVVDPATEQPFAQVALGSAADADRAVWAARRAFPAYAATTRADRIALLQRIVDGFARRHDELAQVVSREMGSPLKAASTAQVASGPNHLKEMIRVLKGFAFDALSGTTLITHEPIGVCALITPWN